MACIEVRLHDLNYTGATYSTYIAFSDVGSLRLPTQVTVYQGHTLDAVLTHM